MWENALTMGRFMTTNNMVEVLEKLFKTRLDERGRIYLPKTVRAKLQINEGDKIYLIIENNHFTVYPAKELKPLLKWLHLHHMDS